MKKRIHRVLALVTAVLLFVTTAFSDVSKAYAAESVQKGNVYETTYAIAELGNPGGYNYTSAATEGGLAFTYSEQYAEVQYAIPEDVINAGFKGYKVGVSSTENLGLKIYSAAGQAAEAYWVDNIALDDDTVVPTKIGFMNCADEEKNFEFYSVTFITANEPGAGTAGTTPETPEAPAENTAKTVTVSASELGLSERWSNGASAADGEMVFPSNYYEFIGTLPQEIPYASIESVTFNVSGQTDSFAVKFYNARVTPAGTETEVQYGLANQSSYTCTLTGEGNLTQIGFMSHVENATYPMTVKLDSVVITLKEGAPAVEPEQPSKPENLVFNENLTFAGRWDSVPTESNVLTFGTQYNEYVFDLGTTLSASQIDSVVVGVSAQGNDIALKLYDDGMGEMLAAYHNIGSTEYTLTPNFDGAVRYVGIMSIPEGAEEYPYSVTIDSITVKLNKSAAEEPVSQDKSDVFTDISLFNRWNQGDVVTAAPLSFSGQYQEYVFDLGKEYDAESVKSIVTEVSGQQGNFCIKLYDSGMNEMQASYNNNGSTSYSTVPTYDGDVRYIAFMSMLEGAEAYPYGFTIEKITVEYTVTSVKLEETYIYTAEDGLSFTNRWTDEAVEGTTLTFEKEWDEYWFTLPKSVRADKIKSLKIKVAAQGLTVAFKYYSGSNEVQAFYGQSGKLEYSLTYGGDDEITAIGVMAMNEQSDKFPGEITIESVTIVVDTTPDTEPPVEKGVEYDIVNLRDEMTAVLGDDFIVGTAISSAEFADAMEMELVTKHFNGVTLGNELKPDSMLRANAEKVMVTVGGQEILFPVLNFDTPDRYLDFFVNWNEENPDKKIRIRGHVLVWHSQTPDFFFREDYDTSKPYVTPDVMNLRLEAYIRGVCEHYTSEGSKYKDLFYGWDVVNEAVSDGSGTYRSASENSTWWKVYQSPEFINNAFVYANRYMPANIALFYNDYNAYQPGKAKGILTLIENVKATPGSRIDGMGMQAHYFCEDTNPTMEAVKKAAKAYGELVDQVQFTEIDFKGSSGPKDEQLAKRYKDLYDTVRRLIAEGTNVTGFTIWGVVDKHSWLQTANGAGGGSNGNSRQYPLLFDNNYKAKPAFYALCNAGELEPEIKNVSMVQLVNGDFSCGEEYTLEGDVATFVPMWDSTGVKVKVNVADTTVEDADAVTVYVYDGEQIVSTTVTRDGATATESGYEAVVSLEVSHEAIVNNKIKLDVVVVNGAHKTAYGDTTFKQADSDKYYAVAATKPLQAVRKGSVVIDGVCDDADWALAEIIPLTIDLGADVLATAKLLWDEEYLYVLVDVADNVLNKDASQAHEQDSVEVFIDENNAKASSYQEDDKQYRINYVNEKSFNGTKCLEENVLSEAVLTEEGYMVEAAFKWTDIEAKAGTQVGLELQINDADATGKRIGTLSWADKTGNGWSAPEVFGTIVLVDGNAEPGTPAVPTPSAPASGSAPSSGSGSTGNSAGTPAQSAPAAETPAAAPASETPGRVTPSERQVESLNEQAEETAAVTETEEAVPAVPETEIVKEVEESDTALTAPPVTEAAVAAPAEQKAIPVAAVAAVVAIAALGGLGAVWFLKLRYLVK